MHCPLLELDKVSDKNHNHRFAPDAEHSRGYYTTLDSTSASLTDLFKFKLHTNYSGISVQIKTLQIVGQAAEFKFESKYEHLPVIWQSLLKVIPEDD